MKRISVNRNPKHSYVIIYLKAGLSIGLKMITA